MYDIKTLPGSVNEHDYVRYDVWYQNTTFLLWQSLSNTLAHSPFASLIYGR